MRLPKKQQLKSLAAKKKATKKTDEVIEGEEKEA